MSDHTTAPAPSLEQTALVTRLLRQIAKEASRIAPMFMKLEGQSKPRRDRHERCPHRGTIDPNAALMAARNNAYGAGLEQAARICEREADLTSNSVTAIALRDAARRIRKEKAHGQT